VNFGESISDSADPTPSRPETDDYDLLTYGEVAARLAELLAAERGALARLGREPQPDPAEVSRLEKRISLLTASESRYRELQSKKDVFMRRFGGDVTDVRPQTD
jgi:hypothetical protein